MSQFPTFDAILLPADGRGPNLVKLMVTSTSYASPYSQQEECHVPHPEIHMDFIDDRDPHAFASQVRSLVPKKLT